MKAFARFLLAVAVSALMLGLLFHLASGAADQPDVRDVLVDAVPTFVILYLVCTLAQSLIRAARYSVLLRAAGEPDVPRFLHIALVTLARNMFVDLLPARLGELSYVALLNRGYRVSTQACLSSLVISFIFDLAALMALLIVLAAMAFARWIPGLLAILALAIAAAFVLIFPAFKKAVQFAKPGGFLRKLSDAFEQSRRAGIVTPVFLLSLGVRLGKYAGFYAMFMAIASASFPQMAAARPGDILISLISAEASSSLPVPTFMSFGAYEAGGTAAWAALGATAGTAATCMLAVHIASQVIDYSLGGLALLVIALVSGKKSSTRNRSLLVIAFAGLLTAAAYAFQQHRILQKRGSLAPPPTGTSVEPATDHRLQVTLPHGFIVWSSNRSGNHDIWKLMLPDGVASQVTTNPNAEYYPRISPDGRSIVFARAHHTWISQRNEKDWDVIWRDLESGEEIPIAINATAPTWADANTIVFEKESYAVIAHDLRTGAERTLCESGRGNIPAGVALQTPQFNLRDNQVAVTFRGKLRMTALVDSANYYRQVGGGCQLAWSPDYSLFYVVDHGGRMENAIYLIDPATLNASRWFDAEGDWSHEYFPKLSADDRWLVYGAAAKGHEHDTADYEIFIWKVGDPPRNATRLTWHTGNDCWPDIFVAH